MTSCSSDLRRGTTPRLELPKADLGLRRRAPAAALRRFHPNVGAILSTSGDQDVHAIMRNQRYGQTIQLLAWRNGQTIGMQVQF